MRQQRREKETTESLIASKCLSPCGNIWKQKVAVVPADPYKYRTLRKVIDLDRNAREKDEVKSYLSVKIMIEKSAKRIERTAMFFNVTGRDPEIQISVFTYIL